MRLLLDTHVYVWFRTLDRKLPVSLKKKIEAADVAYVSFVSLWELAIQASLGRIKGAERFLEEPNSAGLEPLELKPAHIDQYWRNPLHHRDPFDRMLIAQAQCEKLTLASVDGLFSSYDVKLLYA